MKHMSIMLVLLGIQTARAQQTIESIKPVAKDIELSIVPQWHHLDGDVERCLKFGGSWIEAGVITLKKRTKEPINMTHLILSWQGEEIEHLIGSLYRRKPNKDFMPIEQNLICDSHWQHSGQKLIFKFLQPLSLDSITELRLVLTVPADMHATLQKGSLKVEADCLPDQIREMLQNQRAVLTFNTKNSLNVLS